MHLLNVCKHGSRMGNEGAVVPFQHLWSTRPAHHHTEHRMAGACPGNAEDTQRQPNTSRRTEEGVQATQTRVQGGRSLQDKRGLSQRSVLEGAGVTGPTRATAGPQRPAEGRPTPGDPQILPLASWPSSAPPPRQSHHGLVHKCIVAEHDLKAIDERLGPPTQREHCPRRPGWKGRPTLGQCFAGTSDHQPSCLLPRHPVREGRRHIERLRIATEHPRDKGIDQGICDVWPQAMRHKVMNRRRHLYTRPHGFEQETGKVSPTKQRRAQRPRQVVGEGYKTL